MIRQLLYKLSELVALCAFAAVMFCFAWATVMIAAFIYAGVFK